MARLTILNLKPASCRAWMTRLSSVSAAARSVRTAGKAAHTEGARDRQRDRGTAKSGSRDWPPSGGAGERTERAVSGATTNRSRPAAAATAVCQYRQRLSTAGRKLTRCAARADSPQRAWPAADWRRESAGRAGRAGDAGPVRTHRPTPAGRDAAPPAAPGSRRRPDRYATASRRRNLAIRYRIKHTKLQHQEPVEIKPGQINAMFMVVK